jgi:hypothetical protein
MKSLFILAAVIVVMLYPLFRSHTNWVERMAVACEARGGALVKGPGNRPDNSYVCARAP